MIKRNELSELIPNRTAKSIAKLQASDSD